MEEWKAVLQTEPHPLGFLDRKTGQPLTLWDHTTWRFNNCGNAGKLATLRAIKKQIAKGHRPFGLDAAPKTLEPV